MRAKEIPMTAVVLKHRPESPIAHAVAACLARLRSVPMQTRHAMFWRFVATAFIGYSAAIGLALTCPSISF